MANNNLHQIPLYKRVLSYLKPVWLRYEKSANNPYLEVLLYRNRLQLATEDALYSDGDQYTPALEIARHFKKQLPTFESVLLLGVGMGSTVQVFRKLGCNAMYTLVEIDQVVLRLALEGLEKDSGAKLHPICTDAAKFMEENTEQYSFLFIDIFQSRVVPEFVSSRLFLAHCKRALTSNGCIAFNYIVSQRSELDTTLNNFATVFPNYKILESGINRIFVATV